MPELPEVETVTRAIAQVALGKCTENIFFLRKDLRDPIPTKTVKQVLLAQKIQRVFRRSKYICWQTETGYMFLHLGMTGQVIYSDQSQPFKAHTHIIWQIADDKSKTFFLHYIDPRRFGRLSAHLGSTTEDHPFFVHLGVEPLATQTLGEELWQKASTRSAPIKNILMDSKVVVGVGNIYACEALFRARIHPETPGSKLNLATYLQLAQHLQAALLDAIAAGGTSFRDFKHTDGSAGHFVVKLNVYGRKNKPCVNCSNPIQVIKLAGRSTWYCPHCQLV